MAGRPTSSNRRSRRASALLGCAAVLAFVSCQPLPLASPTTASGASDCRVTSVVDGDTVDMTCTDIGPFRARLTGFDTPESFEPGCAAEAQVARQATQRLRAIVAQAQRLAPRIGGTDRFGRRLVQLSIDGQDVGRILISEGLAVPYRGGRRIDWCARLA